MNCPKCAGQKLDAVKVGELKVDHCPACGGLWLDQSELPQLLEAEPAGLKELRRGRTDQHADVVRGKCPRCHTGLLRVASALNRRVTVDKCPDCDGVWLDGGELRALSAAE